MEFKGGNPVVDDCYNTPVTFLVKAKVANDVEMILRDDTENGVTFEGSRGRIFVTRDRIDLSGGSVEALFKEGVPDSLLLELRKGKKVDGHMANFFECCRDLLDAGLRRLVPSPRVVDLPPGEHRHAAGPAEADLGSREGRNRRRFRGQFVAGPAPTRRVRNHDVTKGNAKRIKALSPCGRGFG